MGEQGKVNYIDTWTTLAHYDFNHDRIEVSSFLKQFPELHDFCVKHELGHAEIYKSLGFSWRHYTLDIKDRFRLHNSRILTTQLRVFRKESRPKSITACVFMYGYAYITAITFFFNIIEMRHIIHKKKEVV